MGRRLAVGLGVAGLGWVGLNAAVAFAAAHPIGQGRLLGVAPPTRRTPAELGLASSDVGYAPGRDAWWIPAAPGAPVVVFVHGYGLASDPKSADAGPALDLAAAFHRWGYASLIVNLGYATGAHPYSGGPLEADDIALAATWARHHGGPVALWGFSAGGHAALLAAAQGAPVAAVVADSAFVNARQVVADQAARVIHLPAAVLGLSPTLLGWMAGSGPVDLSTVLRRHPIEVPVMLIQGTADSAVDPGNLRRLADLTGGSAWSVTGADHVRSYEHDTGDYLARARTFLNDHLPLPPHAPPEQRS